VASIAFDDDYDRPAKPPISLHPAFPGIVALWFSALLGLGSLVLPPVLLEKLLTGSGIAALVPAANPPLGFTARALIAVAATVVGAVLGIVIARRVARSHEPKPQSRAAKLVGNSLRPLSVKDELSGEQPIKGDSLPMNRRRALAISEDERPSDFLYHAPLPGQEHDAPAPFEGGNDDHADEEPLELETVVEDVTTPVTATEFEPEPVSGEEEVMIEKQEFQPVSPFQQFEAPEPEPLPEPDAETEPADDIYARKNPLGPRGLEPLPFAAPSLARRAAEAEAQVFAMPEPEPEAQPFAAPVPEPVFAADDEAAAADWESAPLEGLGLVQLVQRLGSTIERRRELRASAPTPAAFASPAPVAPNDFEAAPAEEAAQAMAAFFNAEPEHSPEPKDEIGEVAPVAEEPVELHAAPRPNFLRSLQPIEDHDDGDDGVPDFSLPLRRPSAVPEAFAAPVNDAGGEAGNDAEETEAEDSADAGYSSLLGMKNPFDAPKNEFVRIDEPEEEAELPEPTVTFPGQEKRESFAIPVSVNASRLFDRPGPGGTAAPAAAGPQPAPADADAALRAALATLQKMSSAG